MNKRKCTIDFVEFALAFFVNLMYNHPQISASRKRTDKETNEMKKFTKYLALAMAVVLCLGLLAGCAGGKDNAADGVKTVEAGKLHMSTNAAFHSL